MKTSPKVDGECVEVDVVGVARVVPSLAVLMLLLPIMGTGCVDLHHVEGNCNAVASTLGVLGMCSRKYAHKIPFIVKLNHNELLTYPNKADQIFFGTVQEAYDMGAAAVGATIYFGSEQSGRQIVEVSQAFAQAHELGMATVLWCYLRNNAFKKDKDFHLSADLTGQANHLGVTIQADIIKQKLPENNGGFTALNTGGVSYGKFDKRIVFKEGLNLVTASLPYMDCAN